MTSVISYGVTLTLLAVTHGLLSWSAFWANIFSTAVSTIPSFELNRKWAWGKTGKSHLMKEVVPFWVLAFVGLAFSTWFAVGAEHLAKSHHLSHVANTLTVELGILVAWGLLWVAKFVIFNKLLFASNPEDLPAELDGRSGLPT